MEDIEATMINQNKENITSCEEKKIVLEYPNPANKCLCCLDYIIEKTKYIKLMSCNHEICSECFQRWSKVKDTCPLCRIPISTVFCFTLNLTESNQETENSLFLNLQRSKQNGYYKLYEEDFKFIKDKSHEEDMDLACLDHAYFREEIDKLTRIIFDVRRDRFEVRGAKGTDYEWEVLEQIEIQLDHLCMMNDQLIQFDIKERLNEIYTMAETLFKIKTGKLEENNNYIKYDDDYEYYDYDLHNQEDNEYNDFCTINISNESNSIKKKKTKNNRTKKNQKNKIAIDSM